jgi:hypothetical protein
MKKLLLLSSVLFLVQCTGSNQPETVTTDSLAVADTAAAVQDTVIATSAYEEKLKTLPFTEESSSLLGLELFKSTYKTDNPEENDKALLAYLKFQERLLDSLDYHLPEREGYDKLNTLMSDSIAPEAKFIEKEIQKKGLALGQSEGTLYYKPYPQVIGNYFMEYLTPSTKEYYKQFLKETNQSFSEDAGLLISPKDVADRLIFWDKFLAANPEHFFAADAKNRYNSYLYALLIGMDNTPAFDQEDHKLRQEFSEAYVYVSKNFPGTKTAKIINEYLNVLAENRNTENEKVTKFIQEVKGY